MTSLRVLILGGTAFLGRAVARCARDAGHDVTCAARGLSGAVPDGVRLVRVDRDRPDGLSALDGERFDAVVDLARRPSHVRRALAALGDRAGHWTFVSTCSVYADQATPGQRAESAPLLAAAPPEVDDADGEQYGPCKVADEEAVVASGVPAFVCRAGLIVGPEDPSGRFDYWVARLARGGEVLAPGRPDDLVQWIDVRDLAAWLVLAAETSLTGTYDGNGAPVSRRRFLAGVAEGVGLVPELTWVDQDFLAEHRVQPWMGERSLPMWLPLPDYAGFMTRDVTPAVEAGLRTRPLVDTARDTLEWLQTGPDRVLRVGLDPDEEADVLRSWHDRTS
jgi:nucleoside-diphosphate-sugar epimerase